MQFSASKLLVFKDCKRCFWFTNNMNNARPRGIFPSLPGGIDRVAKVWYDTHRAKGILPPELQNASVIGNLYSDAAQLERWRNWRTGLTFEVDGIKIVMAVDDLLEDPDLGFSPLDAKTRGSAPTGDGSEYYGHQMDLYTLGLQKSGRKITGKSFLAYYWPAKICEGAFLDQPKIAFDSVVKTLESDPDRAVQMVRDAVECLKGPLIPEWPSCEYCDFASTREHVALTPA